MDIEHQPKQPDSTFDDIAPYDDAVFADRLAALVRDKGFEQAVRYVMPGVDYDAFAHRLTAIGNRADFQRGVMADFLVSLVERTTRGVTASGIDNIEPKGCYTYVSNHRDIVLDASLLNLCLLREGRGLAQIAIGNNLLIHDWITDLVRLNGSFIVKRDVKRLEALKAAQHLSEYIHYALTFKHESVWIAQRQGRTKDSNDVRQESLVKMLSIGGQGGTLDNLSELNIVPVSICYEFDPNDYLKLREFVMHRRDAEFKKSQNDDLLSMQTGLMSQKGRVHIHFGRCINDYLDLCPSGDRNTVVHCACTLIDRSIHEHYHFFAINYVAYDMLEGGERFAEKYDNTEKEKVLQYMQNQLAKIGIDDLDADEEAYVRHMFLTMYANPLINHLKAVASNG